MWSAKQVEQQMSGATFKNSIAMANAKCQSFPYPISPVASDGISHPCGLLLNSATNFIDSISNKPTAGDSR